jgi:integrase
MAFIYLRGKTWYLSYTYNGKRVRKPIGKSKKMAELAKADIELKIEKIKAGFVDPRIPLEKFFSQTKERISRLSPKTKQRYSEVLTNFENYYLYQPNRFRYLSDLKTDIFSDFASSEMVRGLESSTINYELRVLHSFFLHFVNDGQLQQSPVKNVQRFDVNPQVPRYLSKTEIENLFRCITPRFHPYFITFLYTGMRRDELRYLEWSDINHNTLYIRPKPHWRPKSKSSIRQIPIHPKVAEAIKLREALSESKTLVFSTLSGNQLGKNALSNSLQSAAKKAEIKDVTVHTFRHTFASHLVQSGVSIYIVSKLLGHASVKQTEIYAHLAPSPDPTILSNNLVFNI